MVKTIKWIIDLDEHSHICQAWVMHLTFAAIDQVGFQTSAYNNVELARRFPEMRFVLEELLKMPRFVETLRPHATSVFVGEPKQITRLMCLAG